MDITLNSDEKILRRGAANLQRGAETVGGELLLTDGRLYFRSHALNLQTGATEIPLSQVRHTRPCWTRFLGLIPLLPNSLEVGLSGGAVHRFVLVGRKEWAAAIDAAAACASSEPKPLRGAA